MRANRVADYFGRAFLVTTRLAALVGDMPVAESSGARRDRAIRCRVEAAKAQNASNAARTPEMRKAYLALAKSWSKLADELDQTSN
jgi:hypothetical protein